MSPDRERELRELLTDAKNLRVKARTEGSASGTVAELEEALAGLLAAHCAPEHAAMTNEVREAVVSRLHDACRTKSQPQTESSRLNGQATRGWLGGVFGRSTSRGMKRWPVWVGGLGLAAGAALLVIYFLSQSGAPTHRQAPLVKEVPRTAPPPETGIPDLKPHKAPQVNVRRVPTPPRSKEPGRTPADEPWKQETYDAQGIDVGRFTAVMGEPTVRRIGTPDTVHALPRQSLVAGVVIETGDADKAEIRFNDGSVVRMSFNAVVAFDYFPAGSAAYESMPRPTRILQLRGRVEYVVAPQKPDNLFAVVTPAATAEALGTAFGLNVRMKHADRGTGEPSFEAILTVRSGRVRFFNSLGKVEVGGMSESIAGANSGPTEPKRLKNLGVVLRSKYLNVWKTSEKLTPISAVYKLVWKHAHARYNLKEIDGQVLVTRVNAGGPAQQAGMRVGDFIQRIGGTPVRNADHAVRTMLKHRGRGLSIDLIRAGQALHVFLTPERYAEDYGQLPGWARQELDAATWSIISGDLLRAEQRLRDLERRCPMAPVFNNLGVFYETRDELGKAIRCYQKAAKASPNNALYELNLGNALWLIGNADKGVRRLENAVLGSKSDLWINATGTLFTCYMTIGRIEDALRLADARIARSPLKAEGWAMRGEALAGMRQYDEALSAYANALRSEPSWSHLQNDLGDLYFATGRFAEAENAYRSAAKLDPTNAYYLHGIAIAMQRKKKLDEAAKIYECILRLRPTDHGALVHYAALLHDQGKLDESEAFFRKAIAIDEDYAFGHLHFGRLLLTKGALAEAEIHLRRAIVLDPADPHNFHNLGRVLEAQKKLSEAESAYREACMLEPDDPHFFAELGLFLWRQNKLQEAEFMFRKAIVIQPKGKVAHHKLGLVLQKMGRLAEAEEALRRAIELSPEIDTAHNDLGAVLGAMGRNDEAAAAFRRAIEVQPKDSLAHFNLGLTHQKWGRLNEAEDALRKACALDPADPDFFYALAGVLEDQKKLAEAEAMYRETRKFGAEPLRPLRELGLFLQRQNRFQEAAKVFQRAIELESGNRSYWRLFSTMWDRAHSPEEAERRMKELIARFPGAAGHGTLAELQYNRLNSKHESAASFGEANRLEPDTPYWMTWLSWVLMELDQDLDRALDLALRVVQLTPQDLNAVSNVGWVYYKRNEPSKAVEYLEKSLVGTPFGKDSAQAETWWVLGLMYERLDRKEAAIKAHRTALARNAKLEKAREALARLGASPPPTS